MGARVTVSILLVLLVSRLIPEGAAESVQESPDGETLRLEGVIVAGNPAHSLALVRRSEARRARTVRIGDEVYGWTLLEVSWDGALFQGAEGVVRLRLSGAREPAVATLTNQNRPPDDDWERRPLSRELASERLQKEMPVLLAETGLAPLMRNGVLLGLRLSRLPDGTVLADSGLLPGDVLISVNEERLESVDGLMRILPALTEEDEMRLVVDRRGEIVKILYELN